MEKRKFHCRSFKAELHLRKVINNSKLIFGAETKSFSRFFGFFLLSCWNVFKVNSDCEFLVCQRRTLNVEYLSFGRLNFHCKTDAKVFRLDKKASERSNFKSSWEFVHFWVVIRLNSSSSVRFVSLMKFRIEWMNVNLLISNHKKYKFKIKGYIAYTHEWEIMMRSKW